MKINRIEARFIAPTLKKPFEIGDLNGHKRIVGSEEDGHRRDIIALQAYTSNSTTSAWSTIDALPQPFYSPEWAKGDWALLNDPKLRKAIENNILGHEIKDPQEFVDALGPIVGHNMLKAGFANLFLDAKALADGVPLYTLVGGKKDKIDAGISMSSTSTTEDVDKKLGEGFRRIKIKVGPKPNEEAKKGEKKPTREDPLDDDFTKIKGISDYIKELNKKRLADEQIQLMIDGNSSFNMEDYNELLMAYGDLGLLMIEQPLAHDDIRHHIELQQLFNAQNIPGKICLDESIETMDQLEQAIDGGISIINIKIARVGGLHIAQQMIEYCQAHSVDTWIGGMVEPTTSKAHSVAMAAHKGVTLPSDISGTEVYFHDDPVKEPMTRRGAYIDVPQIPGRGWDVDEAKLDQITQEIIIFDSKYP